MLTRFSKINYSSMFAVLAIAVVVYSLQPILADDSEPKAAETPSKTKKDDAAVKKDKPNLAQDLIGTWVLKETEVRSQPSGVGTRLKFFTGTHWMITQPDPNTGVIVFHHGGTYTLEGNKMTNKTDFATSATASEIGKTYKCVTTIKGGVMKQKGVDNPYTETWKRVK